MIMTEIEVSRAKMAQERSENAKERAFKASEGRKSRDAQLRAATIGALGKLAGKANHPEWYNKNASLVRDAANISFSTPLGSHSNAPAGIISGIMTFDTHPVLPKSINADNPDFVAREVLQAFRSQYAQIRKANSGAKNYEYTDLARYSLAIQAVYNTLADARRIYGLLRKFDAHNRFVGDALIESLGWDPTNLRSNSSQFRERINYYQKMIQSFALPDVNTVTHRQAWMFSNVFKDSNLPRAQLYAYRLASFYKLDSSPITDPENFIVLKSKAWTNSVTGSSLNFKGLNSFINDMDEMIQALLSDPYAALISGDIMKAYGDSALPVVFADLDIDYETIPTYSPDTLTQIAGIMTIGNTYYSNQGDDPFTVRQVTVQGTNETVLVQDLPYQVATGATEIGEAYAIPYVINSYKEQVTPDDVMVATRMGTIAQKYQEEKRGIHFKTIVCGTEVVSKIRIFYFDIKTNTYVNTTTQSVNMVNNFNKTLLCALAQFDWHPLICSITPPTVQGFESLQGAFTGFLTDLHNFAFIDDKVLSRLHEVAATSLYGLITK